MDTNVRGTILYIFVKLVFCVDDDECLLRLIELWQWIRLFCGYFHVIHDHYFIFSFFLKDKFCIEYWNVCQGKIEIITHLKLEYSYANWVKHIFGAFWNEYCILSLQTNTPFSPLHKCWPWRDNDFWII